jgi:DNA-binding response OmpR family regulator
MLDFDIFEGSLGLCGPGSLVRVLRQVMDIRGRSRLILIADDNEDLAATLSRLVNIAGYQSEVVHDGIAAIREARRHPPDVLLLDIGLPGLDGFQVAERIRDDDRLKSVRIIAISGYPPEMFKGKVAKIGFDHHLVKPVDFNDLLPLLRVPG